MPFGKFKEQSLLKKFEKELRLIPDTRTPNEKKIHSVAILTDVKISDEINIAEKVREGLASVRTTQVYHYRVFNKTDPLTYKHFTEKDIDWNGKIKDASLESFIDNPFDLLIGYFNNKNLYLEYCALKSKATFKIGFAKVNDKIYDLVVSEDPKNIDSFIEIIRKYLELLQKV